MLRLEFATCREDYQAGVGETLQFVMMPDAALAIGEALIERSRKAILDAATKRADKLRAKGKEVDFDGALGPSPSGLLLDLTLSAGQRRLR